MKYLNIILLCLLFTVFTACEDELDQSPISERGSSNFYQSEEDFIQAINGVYNDLRSYPIWHFELSEIRSDNMFVPGAGGVRDYSAVNNFSVNLATTDYISEVWNVNFNGVMRANTVLTELEATNILDESISNRIEGEAKFLRAMYYFDLVRWFGQVPLITETVTPLEALNIPRSPVSEVYEVIIADLQDAITLLPETYDGGNEGRATSHAARGILARVFMTRSGTQLHPSGPTLGTNDYDAALTLLNEIIESGQFSLLESYADIFAYDNENNAEMVFDVQFQSGGLGIGAEYIAWQYPEAYSRAVGIPFAGGAYPDAPKTPSDDVLASFAEEDVRDEVSITDGYMMDGNYVANPFISKYLDLDYLGIDRFDFELNYPVLRYTDVLLLKAEAILQGTAGSQQEVDDIVNEVRERAGLEPVSNVDLNMLLEERRREFIGEGLRWHDLVRTGTVLEVMNNWLQGLEDDGIMPDQIDETAIIYPIPQNQLDVKQGLYEQNPGY
ncbi:RagB/SusD family nutrient uptake outer membrane protein [Catalinimonas sp. 4WD22]|uniref:RagB/SusD family nutrient uptake outer membrane protein n=1 Tax=Catalinimonas locisalis TaxID=3133978 RepID=UPI0031015611